MSDIVVGIKLKADGSGLVGQLTNAKGQVLQFSNATNSAGKQAAASSKNITQMGNATEQLKRQALGLGAILASGFAVRDLVKFADEATNVKNKITDVTSSSEELATMQGILLSTANATRSGLSATTDLYATLNRNARELVKTDQDLVDITGTITKAFALSGATTAEADGAIRQLSQGLAAGALRGDEFNSVAEGAPEIMRAIAKETGLTTGQLRAFAAEGKITADIVIKALQNAAQGIDVRFSKMSATVGQSLKVAENNLIDFLGKQNEALGVTDKLGKGIVGLSENLDTMQDVLVLSASIMAGRYTSSIIAATLAQAALVRQELLSVPAMNAGYAGLGRKVVVMNAATIATNALTISMRGLNVAMGFLGGPVGLAIAAGSALLYFATKSDDAEEKTDKLKDRTTELREEVQKLTKQYLSLNEVGRKIKIEQFTQEEIAAREKLIELQEKLATAERLQQGTKSSQATSQYLPSGNGVANRDITELTAQIAQVDQALDDISIKKKALFDSTLNINDINQNVETSTNNFKAANDKRVAEAISGYQYETEAYDQELQLRVAVLNGSLSKEQAAIYSNLWQKENAQKQQTERLTQQITTYYDTEIEKVKNNADKVVALEQQKADRIAEVKQLSRDNETLLQQEHQLNLDAMNQGFWSKMLDHMKVTTQDFDAMWGSTFESFAQGIGDATATAILEQKNFGDTARAIARGAISELISGIVQLGVKYLAHAAIKKGIAASGAAADLTIAATTGTAMATAYAPAAALASLASFGANSVPAMAGITATVGLSETLALAGIAHDGLPINRNEGTYLVRRDEMVLNPKQRENFEQVVESTKDGGSNGGNVYHFKPTINIDATNATPGMEQKIRSQVQMALDEYDAKLQQDFANNGTRSRMLTGRVG